MRIALIAKRVKSAADADYGHLPSVRVTAQAVHFKKNWGVASASFTLFFLRNFFMIGEKILREEAKKDENPDYPYFCRLQKNNRQRNQGPSQGPTGPQEGQDRPQGGYHHFRYL
jgi:hypothetical protein